MCAAGDVVLRSRSAGLVVRRICATLTCVQRTVVRTDLCPSRTSKVRGSVPASKRKACRDACRMPCLVMLARSVAFCSAF